jgi:hypothetical protein
VVQPEVVTSFEGREEVCKEAQRLFSRLSCARLNRSVRGR